MSVSKRKNDDALEKATNVRWNKVGIILLITYLAAFIDRTNMSIAAPSMTAKLGLTPSEMGVLLSSFFAGYVVSLAFAGYVVTRFGAKRSMVLSLIIFGLASAATGITENYGQLIIVRMILGIGEGFVFPAITLFFVKWFPLNERGRISGLSLLAIPISGIIMSPMGGWLIAHWGYKEMFIVQGLPPVIMALVILFKLFDSPLHDVDVNAKELEIIKGNELTNKNEKTPATDVVRTVYLSPKMWLIGFVYLLWMTGLYGFNQWLPTLIAQASGSGIQAVGWLTATPFVFAAIAMVWISRRFDKAQKKTSDTYYVIIPMALAGLALILQHYIGGNIWVQLMFLIVAGAGVHAAFGPWWPWALQDVSESHTGYASSMVLTIGNFGGIIGPMLVGFITGGGTVADGGFYVIGYVLIISAGLGLVVGLNRNRFVKNKPVHHAIRDLTKDNILK
ncbi:MFS transporter [Klebsiella pneumoniae]|uniref:MFS transporter n=1 Tax=Klebsiella pneumoniae TaxID=573 RepID=UPI001BABC1DB|nr:MFS transporter [Klebsiella pneumoniae]MBQ5265178.1 MFS transporter [Klebsiella pneumoniae]